MTKLNGKAMVDAVEFGQMVYFCTGPGQFPKDGMCEAQGKVIKKVETRFGWMLEVDTGDYSKGFPTYETVSTLRSLDEKGIGAYSHI